MEKIFTGNGIEIFKQNDIYFLIYDAGEISDKMKKIQITEEEAELAQKSSMDAYNVIIKYQNRDFFDNR